MDIEAITEMANRPEVIKICEPQVCFPMQVQNWMVVRVLKAMELLGKEVK